MFHLPTLAEARSKPQACPKSGLPVVLARKERKQSRKEKDEAFRQAVWARDKGKSRATKKPLAKSGTDWAILGEVDHVINRSTAPDRVWDVSNGILLSKEENRLKKARCLHAPEHGMFEIHGPDDRGKKQRFTWRDATGKVIKETVG